MPDTTFAVSPEVKLGNRLKTVDYVGKLRVALRRPIEQTWLPTRPLVECEKDHALLSAFSMAFYKHYPLRLSPDVIWITLTRGFALHVNERAEELRHRFVSHAGQEKLVVTRLDFLPGAENPWPEAFQAFSDQINERTGGLSQLVQADFSTTGPIERAVSHLMAMETFKAYFEYEMCCGCGIPCITLTGTVEDWERLREQVKPFAEFGLEGWVRALDPVLEQFVKAKRGEWDVSFWKSLYRFHGGSGPAEITGWANVLFPYLKDENDKLYPNPNLVDWQNRFEVVEQMSHADRWNNLRGISLDSFPSSFTSTPLTVFWGTNKTPMRLVAGLMGVTQHEETLELAPEVGWAVIYEEPVDPLTGIYQWMEERNQRR